MKHAWLTLFIPTSPENSGNVMSTIQKLFHSTKGMIKRRDYAHADKPDKKGYVIIMIGSLTIPPKTACMGINTLND
jgi:hypothetical protein